MTRHELDLMSLLFGLFFTVLAGGFLLRATTDLRVDADWVLPVALIAVGVVGLAGSFISARAGSTTASAEERDERHPEDA